MRNFPTFIKIFKLMFLWVEWDRGSYTGSLTLVPKYLLRALAITILEINAFGLCEPCVLKVWLASWNSHSLGQKTHDVQRPCRYFSTIYSHIFGASSSTTCIECAPANIFHLSIGISLHCRTVSQGSLAAWWLSVHVSTHSGGEIHGTICSLGWQPSLDCEGCINVIATGSNFGQIPHTKVSKCGNTFYASRRLQEN